MRLRPANQFERNNIMPDLFNLTDDMNSYFNTLPKSLQVTIMQSGAKINSLADLKAVAKEFSGRENTEKE